MSNFKLTDRKIVEVTLKHLAPLQGGESPRSRAAVAREMGLAQKTVAKAITEAFKRHLVSIETKFVPEYVADQSLAVALEAKFPSLKQANVIRLSGNLGSDELHKCLGYAMARKIQEIPFFFRPGDIVGLGSGRGTFFTIEALNKLENIKVRDISLVSLTGSLFPQRTSNRENFLLDADIHAALLAQHFDGQIQVRPICSPIAQPIEERDKIMRGTWLGEGYETHIPTQAIVGVGVLTEQHRFYQEVKSRQKAPVLRPIADDLKALVDLVDTVSNRYRGRIPYCPVADLCNRLFVVPPPENIDWATLNIVKEQIVPLVNRINAHLVTATKTQLGQVDNVILIAGTAVKARAVMSLLRHPVAKVDTICTDRDVAEALIELAAAA